MRLLGSGVISTVRADTLGELGQRTGLGQQSLAACSVTLKASARKAGTEADQMVEPASFRVPVGEGTSCQGAADHRAVAVRLV